MKWGGVAAGIVVLGSSAPGQAVKTSKGYDFHSAYHAGQQLKYSTVMAIYGLIQGRPDRNVGVRMALTLKVVGVKNGHVILTTVINDVRSGKTPLPIRFKPRQFVVDRRNKVIGSTEGSNAIVPYPNHPVKIGDSWTALTTVATGPESGMAVQATYRFESVKAAEGKKIITLDVTFKGFANGTGAVLVNASDGTVESLVSELTVTSNEAGAHRIQLIFKRV